MRIGIAEIIIFVGFLIIGLGYVPPHFLPEEAYEVFFGAQLTTLIGLVVCIIGLCVKVKQHMRDR